MPHLHPTVPKPAKFIFLTGLLLLLTCLSGYAQKDDTLLTKVNLSDTVLGKRTLTLPLVFNPQEALYALFPGKHYRLSHENYTNELINWSCKSCKTEQYKDVNEDGVPAFPFEGGVATRLINVMDFTDAGGAAYKIMSFNHSEFDEEGMQTSRFTGGLLGLAKFALTSKGWELKFFQPAIAAYGAFAQCPTPRPLLIGEHQYAFMIRHSNGGGGGPFDGDLYLLAGAGGKYQQMMAAYGIERTAVDAAEGLSSWSSTYSVPASAKKYFRDIVVITKGTYTTGDHQALPPSVKKLVRPRSKGEFTVIQKYVYTAAKGYQLQQNAQVTVKPNT